jgi:hypothetical protein
MGRGDGLEDRASANVENSTSRKGKRRKEWYKDEGSEKLIRIDLSSVLPCQKVPVLANISAPNRNVTW